LRESAVRLGSRSFGAVRWRSRPTNDQEGLPGDPGKALWAGTSRWAILGSNQWPLRCESLFSVSAPVAARGDHTINCR